MKEKYNLNELFKELSSEKKFQGGVISKILVDGKPSGMNVEKKGVVLIKKDMIERMKKGLSINNTVMHFETWWNLNKPFYDSKLSFHKEIIVNKIIFHEDVKEETKKNVGETHNMHISKKTIEELIKKMKKEDCHWIEVRFFFTCETIVQYINFHILNFEEFFTLKKEEKKTLRNGEEERKKEKEKEPTIGDVISLLNQMKNSFDKKILKIDENQKEMNQKMIKIEDNQIEMKKRLTNVEENQIRSSLETKKKMTKVEENQNKMKNRISKIEDDQKTLESWKEEQTNIHNSIADLKYTVSGEDFKLKENKKKKKKQSKHNPELQDLSIYEFYGMLYSLTDLHYERMILDDLQSALNEHRTISIPYEIKNNIVLASHKNLGSCKKDNEQWNAFSNSFLGQKQAKKLRLDAPSIQYNFLSTNKEKEAIVLEATIIQFSYFDFGKFKEKEKKTTYQMKKFIFKLLQLERQVRNLILNGHQIKSIGFVVGKKEKNEMKESVIENLKCYPEVFQSIIEIYDDKNCFLENPIFLDFKNYLND